MSQPLRVRKRHTECACYIFFDTPLRMCQAFAGLFIFIILVIALTEVHYFADVSVRAIFADIDPVIYAALVTRGGNEEVRGSDVSPE